MGFNIKLLIGNPVNYSERDPPPISHELKGHVSDDRCPCWNHHSVFMYLFAVHH